MRLRALLVALVLASTAGFVVGVAIEHDDQGHDDHPAAAVEAAKHHDDSHAAEGTAEHAAAEHNAVGETTEAHAANEELHPFGISIESTPFVALAVAASALLALAAWLRPNPVLLALIAVAMLAFAALDAREVAHQLDEDRTRLALLAALVAALHAASAIVAVLLARRRRPEPAGGAGTIPA
jgi:hypothetical protein